MAHAPAIWNKRRSFMRRRILLCGYWRIQSQIYRFLGGLEGRPPCCPIIRRRERSPSPPVCLTLCPSGNTLRIMSTVEPPINLQNWIEENRQKFKPPVSNRYLYDGRDFFVMVIKGPNARNDFHLVDSEE